MIIQNRPAVKRLKGRRSSVKETVVDAAMVAMSALVAVAAAIVIVVVAGLVASSVDVYATSAHRMSRSEVP